MQIDLQRLLEAAAAAVPGAQWVGLRKRRSTATFFVARDAAFEEAATEQSEGVMVEVFHQGQFCYAATADLTPSGVARAAVAALATAKAVVGRGVFSFDQSVRPATAAHYESPRRLKSPLGTDVICAYLIEACQALKVSDKVIQTMASVGEGRNDYELVSTSGARIEQTLHFHSLALNAVARDGNVVQRRTANGPWALAHQGGSELLDFPRMLAQATVVGREAVELLGAAPCPTDTRTLVLAPDQMMLQIHESIGHPLELDRILGDERNYAGSSFVKLADFGTFQYGSPLMNVSFDPTLAGELASYAADEIGNKAEKLLLIEKGILKRGLGSLESQKRSGVPGVANQRASSWNRPPADRMANLNLEPGDTSFKDLIAGIEKGVYMQANRSWSIDDYRNKFQFGCEYGQLIENGKLTATVRDPNYRGISSNFWRNLSAVGDRASFQAFGTPNCGKCEPNQVMFVGHASPVCAFDNVEVFGGGK
ncbi:MAG: Zn-dependent protease [Spirochaetes bacterium GWD1_61_31]|nr:MAG: Zn-dependent protease [Spirochaetes bacterium GWB1_60_80]OHD32627.1 MAG: Zn-dependent protease [Spirochaetes bacterium GWC1_61_12]OHD35728.1 MAG: Zn-dependent protease [Spirochaetes bacterium GWD1_61_31]OHD41894.1 MAG: Zn-dependent protease [Spirochaetes bacterium GWE1_60_18]OHD57869.1 MAG: Zn-dependent protease [Spirochaetes bacterium GWF1_60_12]HAP44327.1 Zn-dependent protease [Spirochaetaceae bacterium]